jgi:hypothetical protein
MKSKMLRLLIAPVLAGAILLSGTDAAQAIAPSTEAASWSAAEAKALQEKAVQVSDAVYKSLTTTNAAEFTGADGQVHRMRVAGGSLTVDGQAIALGASHGTQSPITPAGWFCDLKVAAAVAAILAVGAGFILWVITGLAIGTIVSIAGLSFSVGTWSTIALIMGSAAVLSGFLHTVLC